MPIQIITELLREDSGIVSYFASVKDHWDSFLSGFNWNSPNAEIDLTNWIYDNQITMESKGGGRWLGQEIMVAVGIAYYYDEYDGYGENLKKAELIYQCIARSMCSIEVKWHADDYARIYGLIEPDYGS